jgi:predicted ribosomally synthesized peptide with SipW-like signal peptide
MSSKKLMTGLTILVVVMLALMGVGYAAWTDQLNINGTVTTGTLDVKLQVPGFDPSQGCTMVLSNGDDTLTLAATNVTPGMVCWSQIEVNNVGSIPVLISVDSVETGAGFWDMDCNFDGMTLAAHSFGGECLVWADIPADNSSQGQTAGIAITVNAVQAP